jgi:hypothetical protein
VNEIAAAAAGLLGAIVGATAVLLATRQQIKASVRERALQGEKGLYIAFLTSANRVIVTWYHRSLGQVDLARKDDVSGIELEGGITLCDRVS